MIWGCPYFRKPLYVGKRRGLSVQKIFGYVSCNHDHWQPYHSDKNVLKKQQLKAHSARHKQVLGILKSMGVGELGAEIDAYVCVCINMYIYIYTYMYMYMYMYIILYYTILYHIEWYNIMLYYVKTILLSYYIKLYYIIYYYTILFYIYIYIYIDPSYRLPVTRNLCSLSSQLRWPQHLQPGWDLRTASSNSDTATWLEASAKEALKIWGPKIENFALKIYGQIRALASHGKSEAKGFRHLWSWPSCCEALSSCFSM